MQCGKSQTVTASRAKTYKYCSYACRGAWRSAHFSGANNPNWKGGVGVKECQFCGNPFTHEILTTFNKMKFCSKPCADMGGFRYRGKEHWNYSESARRKNRGGSHRKWVNAVISRDGATCQQCGATNVELHAHHKESFREYPEKRFDVDNGITLCYRCHWDLHTALNENGVNSGETASGHAGGNPEPSLEGNLEEGVTTRGRAYRRWNGHCDYCGAFLSRRFSDVKGKAHIFCDHACRGKWQSQQVKAVTPPRAPRSKEMI